MRVFLDDERATPEGWVRAYWPDEVIALLETGVVAELSLDHDLGDDQRGGGLYRALVDRRTSIREQIQAAKNDRSFG